MAFNNMPATTLLLHNLGIGCKVIAVNRSAVDVVITFKGILRRESPSGIAFHAATSFVLGNRVSLQTASLSLVGGGKGCLQSANYMKMLYTI
jgi:hypothetical protein